MYITYPLLLLSCLTQTANVNPLLVISGAEEDAMNELVNSSISVDPGPGAESKEVTTPVPMVAFTVTSIGKGEELLYEHVLSQTALIQLGDSESSISLSSLY